MPPNAKFQMKSATKNLFTCPACGAVAVAETEVESCFSCWHQAGAYAPGASLRASYNQTAQAWRGEKPEISALFPPRNRNGVAQTALACATYAMIPYLGLLFCPAALLLGGWGVARSYWQPQQGGRNAAWASVALGLGLSGLQLVLWWLMYQVPGWAAGR